MTVTLVDAPVSLGHLVHELRRVAVVLRQARLQQRLDHISVVRLHGDGQRRATVVQRLVQFRAKLTNRQTTRNMQSYRRAVPTPATPAHFTTHRGNVRPRDLFRNRVALTFDLIFLAQLAAAMTSVLTVVLIGQTPFSLYSANMQTHTDRCP